MDIYVPYRSYLWMYLSCVEADDITEISFVPVINIPLDLMTSVMLDVYMCL